MINIAVITIAPHINAQAPGASPANKNTQTRLRNGSNLFFKNMLHIFKKSVIMKT